MIDIVGIHDGEDLHLFNAQTVKAQNILSVQLGSLEYAPDLGIDLAYFLSEQFRFQNESFKSYCISTLATYGISVAELVDTEQSLFRQYEFILAPEETTDGLIAR